MANHVHNLSTPPTVDAASAFVARFAQRYAQVRNRQRDGSGKLFEERYFSKPILSGDQLAITTLYIEANPVRAGLVTDPIEYPWSTYALHAGEPERSAIPRSLWRPNAWYLSLGKTDRDRGLRYRELYRVYVETGQRPEHWFQADRIERAASEPYTRRLLRPDGSRAAEPNGFVRFGPEPEED